MKKKHRYLQLNVPVYRSFKKALTEGSMFSWLAEEGERTDAGSVSVKFKLNRKPWALKVEARRVY